MRIVLVIDKVGINSFATSMGIGCWLRCHRLVSPPNLLTRRIGKRALSRFNSPKEKEGHKYIPYFLALYGFLPRRCLESEMGPQIPPASIVTKVGVLEVYNNAAECSFARIRGPSVGKNRSWQKTVKHEKIR